MIPLIFATNNQNKIDEIRSIPNLEYEIISLKEEGINIDIPEPYDTLEKNATEKSRVIYKLTGKNCFSEDTGLEVEALKGEPGVKSARYAGEEKSFEKNIEKLLTNLQGSSNRQAQFKTVFSLMLNGAEYKFEGLCKGIIIAHTRGSGGFGYDSIFVPLHAEKTFAEMSIEEKNKFSHRKQALDKMMSFLKSLK